MTQLRTHHRVVCKCGRVHWTSAQKWRGHLCGDCRRKAHTAYVRDHNAGLVTYDRRRATMGPLASRPCPVQTVGRCACCKRKGQQLANGKCEDCRFYSDDGTDETRAAAGRLGGAARMRNYKDKYVASKTT